MPTAIMIRDGDARQTVGFEQISEDDLPPGDVTVRVICSTLNYKDALAITGKGRVVRQFPMVPGIDLAGTVERSDNAAFQPGDKVILNGWGVGEGHWGGLAEIARVKAEWLLPLNPAFTCEDAMSIGTAGYTAMLCVMALQKQGLRPDKGPVLVTGASGGVGSVAVALLSRLGFEVAALTGRPQEAAYLEGLGARQIVDRADYAGPGKPLSKEQWVGAVDVVGGQVLANVCAAMRYDGAVAACGLAGGMALPATVAPFILRGVTLLGVDSVMCPRDRRMEAWDRLAQELDPKILSSITQHVALKEVIPMANNLLAGIVRGRIVVPMQTA